MNLTRSKGASFWKRKVERNGAKAGVEAETTWWVEVSSRCARYTYPLTVRGALPPLSALHASSSLLLLRSFLRIQALLPSHEERPVRARAGEEEHLLFFALHPFSPSPPCLSSCPSARFVSCRGPLLAPFPLVCCGCFL